MVIEVGEWIEVALGRGM